MRKLVVTGHDIGFSNIYDIGAIKAMDEGIITTANVIIDCRDGEEVLKKLKDRPWITITWERKMWYRPISDPKDVPSMVNEEGFYKWGHVRFTPLFSTATYEDCYREFTAQVEKCYELAGRYPFVCNSQVDDGELGRAWRDVCKKYNILINPFNDPFFVPGGIEGYDNVKNLKVDPYPEDMEVENIYDNKLYDYFDMTSGLEKVELDDEYDYSFGLHAGFVDDVITNISSLNIHRLKECNCALDQRTKEWIKREKVELVNLKDLLTGSNDYQNHLKEINSELWIGNILK